METQASNYACGHNMPGYMPESDVEIFDTFADARDYLVDELRRYADHLADGFGSDDVDADVRDAESAADTVSGWEGPDTTYTDAHPGLAWWIMETYEDVTGDES